VEWPHRSKLKCWEKIYSHDTLSTYHTWTVRGSIPRHLQWLTAWALAWLIYGNKPRSELRYNSSTNTYHRNSSHTPHILQSSSAFSPPNVCMHHIYGVENNTLQVSPDNKRLINCNIELCSIYFQHYSVSQASTHCNQWQCMSTLQGWRSQFSMSPWIITNFAIQVRDKSSVSAQHTVSLLAWLHVSDWINPSSFPIQDLTSRYNAITCRTYGTSLVHFCWNPY
jgi:hypothetical protein